MNANGAPADVSRERAERFLRDRGADAIAHPGGTLLAHLIRVADVLADWGADADVQLAGLCHATYGTDGFDRSLLDPSARQQLSTLLGERAEALVYLYGSCDRSAVYPRLDTAPIVFRDRFTGLDHEPAAADLRAFMEITAANELDVMAHNAELAARHGAALYGLFAGTRSLLSERAWLACRSRLGPEAEDAAGN
ncbi:hypothetical protein HLB23_34760 [Nocardia uniformis]|uniref:DUF6817 domain-containing protein n=1 Tax=Nocardia uniformis TaxID=53432 RepID=A0A849C8F3_9NOCA|nr:hypothetical protein [Nocardia uniformis]NNH74954.1 hypothetical protein [Nocardia uniformis]